MDTPTETERTNTLTRERLAAIRALLAEVDRLRAGLAAIRDDTMTEYLQAHGVSVSLNTERETLDETIARFLIGGKTGNVETQE